MRDRPSFDDLELATWHWMLFDARFAKALALMVVGCVVLFATLFARRRD